MDLRKEVRKYINQGVMSPNELFKLIYPKYTGHYSHVREAIHAEKNR